VSSKEITVDTFIYYVLPNVVLFGGIYAVAKYVENATEDFINNYEQYQQKLVDFRRKLM
jgi:hypothetical protein